MKQRRHIRTVEAITQKFKHLTPLLCIDYLESSRDWWLLTFDEVDADDNC
jgi:hypothetical protein